MNPIISLDIVYPLEQNLAVQQLDSKIQNTVRINSIQAVRAVDKLQALRKVCKYVPQTK